MPTPEVSVIVPVRNGADSLPPLLESIRAQTLARERFEVVVVDNDSSDGTAEVAAAHGARVVEEPVANRSRARNRGAAAAQARLYAFTDADCVADPGWLEALLACAGRAPLVAGEVELRVSEQPNAIERFEALWRFGQSAWVDQGWAATANLLVEAEAFEAIGGFDSSWRHIGEDVDFCWRARDAGYGLGFCPDARVGHLAESEPRPFLRRFFLHGYSVNQVFYRWGEGYQAWRRPRPALRGDRALREYGHSPESFDAGEWRRMARLARLGYATRVAGSAWAELSRAR
ncbi:MAG TPA: glycosyltransferase family 2 protein [Thermoleophilaceae bacterium]|nr:glycosyltransferase family 2 protein [Thermoleophilaceae bacterium]